MRTIFVLSILVPLAAVIYAIALGLSPEEVLTGLNQRLQSVLSLVVAVVGTYIAYQLVKFGLKRKTSKKRFPL